MKFYALILELQAPQNFRHTDRQAFPKNNKIVFRTSQNLQIHQIPEIEIFYENNTFFYLYRKKQKS